MSGANPSFSGRGSGRGPDRKFGKGGGGGGGMGFKGGNRKGFGGGGDKDSWKFNGKSRQERAEEDAALEARLGFEHFTDGPDRLGWLLNMGPTSIEDKDTGRTLSAVNCFFMCQDGSMFKAHVVYAPYFYIATKENMESEVDAYLRRRFEGLICDVATVGKEDLDMKNHLSGLQRKYLKLSFNNVNDLMEVRKEIMPIIKRNKVKSSAAEAYQQLHASVQRVDNQATRLQDYLECIVDIREYDVQYHYRFSIDMGVRCAKWYTVKAKNGVCELELRPDLLQRAEVRICAFDIETTKLPLQFPNPTHDEVFMISYMLDKQGYLIINRQVVGADVHDFEYTPKPEYEGPFIVWNCKDEKETLRKWFDHMKAAKPGIYVTYNGDWFDWPFIQTRAKHHGMDMKSEIGFWYNEEQKICSSKFGVHMDCLAWVNRDSYLPQGSRGLKAVCKAKLGYDPIEVDPEDMLKFAQEQPQTMAAYSVSDAVATMYLYLTYVHPFIFSLATIIPMPPDDVLRKGSGTLCEMLLMVEAFNGNIVCPNKYTSEKEKMYDGHLLESETYIGGHVEALESGVFRSDLPCRFRLKPEAYQGLIDNLDRDLEYAIRVEGKMDPGTVTNYAEVRAQIEGQLAELRDTPNREENPLIYHLDVAAMYPNIILTNRLQPPAIVNDEVCAACDFNRPDKTCERRLEWVWRGEHYSAKRSEYTQIKNQLESDTFPGRESGDGPRYFRDLSPDEQALELKSRLKKYCQKVYKRVMDKPKTEHRVASVCMRENPFYVDTVKAFRDRRYEYKGLNKKWKGKLSEAKSSGNKVKEAEAEDMCVLYDSLQLAHKCILNSFYGYVMRKGARWYSMEMAGVVTYTGAKIIQRAADLVHQIGRPLELDTDGIWCVLPGSFPENYQFKGEGGKKLTISYPCVMLNVAVAENNTNDQYQTLVDKAARRYETSSEMSIEFEVDGPYKAMVLPASQQEDKGIKKRYAVFNDDGSLAEMKGFELKRRGELKLIKVFQSEVFENFLEGQTLEDCYNATAGVANRWLDMLENKGDDLSDEELLEYIGESTTMSKSVEECGDRKSCAITTARRLSQFLGGDHLKDKGLNCSYIIACAPAGAPTSERAIPTTIFRAEPAVARSYLRRWTREDIPGDGKPDMRLIVDWAYYTTRLGSAIQKIITIPAAMQKVANPVPRVKHPDWLLKRVRAMESSCKQRSITDTFKARDEAAEGGDIEDMGGTQRPRGVFGRANPRSTTYKRAAPEAGSHAADDAAHEEGEGAGPAEEGAEEEGGEGGAGGGNAGEPEEEVPSRTEDYQGWLEHQKRKWRAQREERKRRKTEQQREEERARFDAVRQRPRGPSSNVGAFFRHQNAAVTQTHWQVVTLSPGRTAGEFTAWVMVAGSMYSVPLKVPRSFLVNSRRNEAEGGAELGRRVTRRLPHSRGVQNLYEVTADEADFSRGAQDLHVLLAQPHVEGVYETQVPLDLHAVLELGCVCSVVPDARDRSLAAGFQLRELRKSNTAECPYLEEAPGTAGALRHVAVYHSSAGSERAVVGLLLPATRRLTVLVVNAFRGAEKELTRGRVEASVRRLSSEAAAQGTAGFPEGLDVEVKYVESEEKAMRFAQTALTAFRDETRGTPTVVVAQSPLGEASLAAAIPELHRYPMVSVPANAADSAYPAMAWQRKAGELALVRLMDVGDWLATRVEVARYAHLPVSAFGSDWRLSTMDAFFARKLRDAKHALWMSRTGVPDLGDGEAVEGNLGEELSSPELVYPGAYRSVCVEIKVNHLAVNAIDKSALINELEGGTLLGMEGSEGAQLLPGAADEAMGCAPAFKVLKSLVQSWLADAVQNDNEHADQLLSHLYQWICSPQSRLHDPALHRLVHMMMHKVFLLLVAELRKLGAKIVYADFHQLTICTGKRDLASAKGYCDYLVATLQDRELFSWLVLEPKQYWQVYLFRDLHNYAGIACSGGAAAGEEGEGGAAAAAAEGDAPGAGAGGGGGAAAAEEGEGAEGGGAEGRRRRRRRRRKARGAGSGGSDASASEEEDDDEGDSEDDDDDDEGGGDEGGAGGKKAEAEGAGGGAGRLEIKNAWNLALYLPQVVQEYFYIAVSELIYLPHQKQQELEQERAAAEGGPTPGVAIRAQEAEAEEVEHLKSLINGHFTKKVLRWTREIHRHIGGGDDDPTHAFPQLAGSNLSPEELGSPALAFVRAVCHVFMLDPQVEHEVRVMRRNALKLLGVREFAPEAAFVEPCLSFVLRGVICEYCNDCRDLDLCRDPQLQEGEWRCSVPECAHPYDMSQVESTLLQLVRRRVRSFQLQDLRDAKTKRVVAGQMSAMSKYTAGVVSTETPEDFRKSLRVFHNIAEYHEFHLLRDTVQWLLAA